MSFDLCNKGDFFQLNNTYSEKGFRERYTKEHVIKVCKWYQERYGKINSIKLKEVLGDKVKIFRYKVHRDKSDFPQEIRIHLNSVDQVYHVSSKIFWSDHYYKRNEYAELSIRSKSDISDKRKKELELFALKSDDKCERKSMPIINEENTEYRSFRKGWIPLMLTECDSIKEKNGKIRKLRFEQYLSDDVYGRVYRFLAYFENLTKPSEIRIYASIKDKYRGIFVVDRWYSRYLEFEKAKKRSEKDLKNKLKTVKRL
ncbi:hypothetical protein BTO06_07805 [Tenacibaculum sp. SZ-18]|nr:hypothetical protein BTO06_07805 [Tenacibaculum sp. SZ-18]